MISIQLGQRLEYSLYLYQEISLMCAKTFFSMKKTLTKTGRYHFARLLQLIPCMVVKGSKNVIAARMDVEQIYASVSRQILSATAGAIPIPV